MPVFQRILEPPKSTFFLLGPRGTGKSTWLQDHFPSAFRVDLLRSAEFLRYQSRPGFIRDEVLALSKGSTIIIDEIQKLPILLDEVQALLFDTREAYSFALTGSSARKLKRENANLLAGRALTRKFFPILSSEMGSGFDIHRAMQFGMLPRVLNLESEADQQEFLYSYVETYLKEEIQQEALVRNLSGFHRFLRVAALGDGQILNLSNIARDVGVARSTVQGYFDIFIDTLLGFFVPAFQPKAKVKEIAHPKFYWFDLGVLRAVQGTLHERLEKAELGYFFETFLINEMRAFDAYLGRNTTLSYWRTESGTEVDCIWTYGRKSFGVEFKFTQEWKPEFNRGLITLLEEKKIQAAFGVYAGTRPIKSGTVWVFPFRDFLDRFKNGDLMDGVTSVSC